MFYSQFILAKKGPLGTIWIAAHLERKLRKNQVADTDIGVSVDSIISPEVPIALRLSSHLLLGVVRIYSKKVNYLFDDCSDALLKIRQAFRSTAVDLPPEESKAPYHSITLPETFDLDDFELPDNELLQGNFDHHVSSREQITLQDTLDGVTMSTSKFGLDERFGDGDASQIGLDLDEALFCSKGEASEQGDPPVFHPNAEAALGTSFPLKVDDHTMEISDSDAARVTSANYSSIQAPSTPGLLEEPNLPGNQDAHISDDHMDEDGNLDGSRGKETTGQPSSEAGPCQIDRDAAHSITQENGCQQDMQETILVESSLLVTEPMDCVPVYARPSPSNKLMAASKDSDMGESFRNGICTNTASPTASLVDSETPCGESNGIRVNDFASTNDSNVKGSSTPVIPGSDTSADTFFQTDACPPMTASRSVDVEASLKSDTADIDKNLDNNNNTDGEDASLDMHEPMVSTLSPALRACISLPGNEAENLVCNKNITSGEVELGSADNLASTTNLKSEVFGHRSTESAGGEDDCGISGVSVAVQNVIEASTDVPIATCGEHGSVHNKQDNVRLQDAQLEKENSSDVAGLQSPERLLSGPVLPATQATELMLESTPEKQPVHEESVAVSGKKRSYTESTLTVQSLNSENSSLAAQSKRSGDFVPEDDDLLSSILVGRKSSALKLKPTPPVPEMVTKKRQRLAVRASACKRKALVDDAMVLHGDTIRQQLLNTEDIRRIRKKAPCTRPEIWMLQKLFLEEEIYSEPVFTGMSQLLVDLHTETFDFSETRIIKEDQSNAHPIEETEVERHASQTVAEESNFKTAGLSSVVRDNEVACLPSPKDSNDGTYRHSEHDVSGHIATAEMEINDRALTGEAADRSVSIHANFQTSGGPSSDATYSMIDSSVYKLNDATTPVPSCAPVEALDQNSDVQLLGQEASCSKDISVTGIFFGGAEDITGEMLSKDEVRGFEDDRLSEKFEHTGAGVSEAGILEESSLVRDTNTIAEMSFEDSSYATALRESEAGFPNENEVLASDVRCNDRSPTSDRYLCETQKLEQPSEASHKMEHSNLVDRENAECQQAHSEIIQDSTTCAPSNSLIDDYADFEAYGTMHDTDFLNVDDDEMNEPEDSSMPNTEEARLLDNSGWSSRTRAVANYLQGVYNKEVQHGRKVIHMDHLLSGKTRKEASRMFFETLVLKTKDYIHVEQPTAYNSIAVKPRGKLMKSEF